MEYKICNDKLPAAATKRWTWTYIVAIADGLIKLEAIIIHNYTSPPGSIYYIVALKFTCGALKCCGLVPCKLNIRLYAPLGISVDSSPAMQALAVI